MKFYKIYTILAVSATLAASCNKIKDFGDTNVNPQEITVLSTSALISNAQVGAAGWANSARAGMYAQYFSEAEYPSTSRYSIPQLSFGGNYSGNILSLKNVIEKSSNPNEVAVAKILTQYIYWNMTDLWGDIPYSQAMKGSGVIPTYDKQEDIYKGMIATLKSAVTEFSNSYGLNGDLYYGSNTSTQLNNWKKFANSMRCLMALRLSKKYPGPTEYAATEFRAALASGVIEVNSENCQLAYPGGSYRNPYFETHLNARDLGESLPLVNLLNSYGDARQSAFGSSNVGVPYGFSEGNINTWREANPTWARIFSDNYRTETYPTTIMNAGEVFLARAEAADRLWTTESTSAMFMAGVNASFIRWGLPAPSATYFTQAANILGLPGTNLKPIATQRYIATFPNGIQGWSEWRRTGYPVLTPAVSPLSTTHTQIPSRYTYATDEYTLNPAGVAAAVSRLLPTPTDVQESKVWWNQ